MHRHPNVFQCVLSGSEAAICGYGNLNTMQVA